MLSSNEHIERLTEELEVRFLANQDENLHFGLLTDYMDSDSENLPEDEPLLTSVSKKIEELNVKYKNAGGNNLLSFSQTQEMESF